MQIHEAYHRVAVCGSLACVTVNQVDMDRVVTAAQTLPSATYPGGWPGEIEAALLDAVLSIQAVYGGPATGVRAAIESYRKWQQRASLDDLSVLAGLDPMTLSEVLPNRQKTSGRLKTVAIVEAAANLARAGVVHAVDLDPKNAKHKRAYTSVLGLAGVTWTYLGMNLGRPGVKADTMIIRFLERTLGRPVSTAEAQRLVMAAAERLELDPIRLDYAIWIYMSGESRGPQ